MIKRLIASQKIRFGMVGILNTLLDIGIYWLLTNAGLRFFFANLISTSAGLACSYVLNRAFTFTPSNRKLHHELGLFLAITLVGLWVIQPSVIYMVSQAIHIHRAAAKIIVPKLAAICVALVWNYLWYRNVVFKHRPSIAD